MTYADDLRKMTYKRKGFKKVMIMNYVLKLEGYQKALDDVLEIIGHKCTKDMLRKIEELR